MCVIFFAYRRHPRYPLILLANRDEFYERPTARAAVWEDFPNVYAGRDLVHGGTWLGIARPGRFAAVTNYRDPLAPTGKHSRGDLVGDFLKRDAPVEDYLSEIEARAADFSGFNLLVGEINEKRQTVGYFSNRDDGIKILAPGVYGLSNHLLDTPWRKVEKGKAALSRMIADDPLERESLLEILADRTLADDAELPDTGIGYEREKLLSAIFIETPIYGTRSSSLVTIDAGGEISLDERSFD